MPMTHHTVNLWVIAGSLVILAAVGGFVLWRNMRTVPTAEETERARRDMLVQHGRIVDGTLLEVARIAAQDGRGLTMLLFHYRIGGVNYECSQDITDLLNVVDVDQVRGGFPCSVRYQPGNPQSSIVVAEQWSGLREKLPQFPVPPPPGKMKLAPLRHGRG